MRGLRLGLGLIANAASGGGSGGFTPASMSPSAWYDPSDLTTLFQDSAGTSPVTATGQTVQCMKDKSGNAHDFTKGTTGQSPTYQSDASGSYLLFDGVDDNLTTTWTLTFPFDRIMAWQQVSWTLSDCLISSAGPTAKLFQSSATPTITLHDGTGGVVTSSAATIGTNFVATERHISGASQLAVNNNAYSSGNAGTTVPGTQLILGAGTNAGGNAGNVRFYGGVIKLGTISDSDIASLRTYFGAKCGLTL